MYVLATISWQTHRHLQRLPDIKVSFCKHHFSLEIRTFYNRISIPTLHFTYYYSFDHRGLGCRTSCLTLRMVFVNNKRLKWVRDNRLLVQEIKLNWVANIKRKRWYRYICSCYALIPLQTCHYYLRLKSSNKTAVFEGFESKVGMKSLKNETYRLCVILS